MNEGDEEAVSYWPHDYLNFQYVDDVHYARKWFFIVRAQLMEYGGTIQ